MFARMFSRIDPFTHIRACLCSACMRVHYYSAAVHTQSIHLTDSHDELFGTGIGKVIM